LIIYCAVDATRRVYAIGAISAALTASSAGDSIVRIHTIIT
jgi:hypothetical protein